MYRRISRRLWIGLAVAAGSARAQAQPAAPVTFEVVAIRTAPPFTEMVPLLQSGKAKVGMTVEGSRVNIGFVSLADLAGMAYNVRPDQLQGPDWMSQQRFDIQARIPDGVSKDKVPEMLQALLADRFKATLHKEKKDQPVYALTVGKNGAKLTEAVAKPDADPANGLYKVVPNGPNGAEVRFGTTRSTAGPEGIHLEIGRITMPALAQSLSAYVDKPVVDMTGLTGEYQVPLDLSLEDTMRGTQRLLAQAGVQLPLQQLPGASPGEASTPAGGSVLTAVEKLGLKLVARKAPVEVIVIDHLERSPTGN